MEKQKKRLTTDDPQNNIETMLNYCYAKDGCVTIRGMENQSFIAYLRGECRARGCDLFDMDDAETMDCIMECAFSAPECPIFMLYVAAFQAAELRHRLKAYEDTGVEPNDVLTGAEIAKVSTALEDLKARQRRTAPTISPSRYDSFCLRRLGRYRSIDIFVEAGGLESGLHVQSNGPHGDHVFIDLETIECVVSDLRNRDALRDKPLVEERIISIYPAPNTTYIRLPGGIRLICKYGVYIGWYQP